MVAYYTIGNDADTKKILTRRRNKSEMNQAYFFPTYHQHTLVRNIKNDLIKKRMTTTDNVLIRFGIGFVIVVAVVMLVVSFCCILAYS